MEIEQIRCISNLMDFIGECAKKHGADGDTEVFVREGADGPMRRIAAVKMGQDNVRRGVYLVFETSAILIS